MKIGVIGLGGIFKKAYLKTYSKSRADKEFYFASKNQETLRFLKEEYGFTHFAADLDGLLAAGIQACCIHSATKVHFALAKRCLQAGVHVYMDKPLSEELTEVEELYELAAANGLLLMTGFNRRFAPFVQELKALPAKRLIQLEKHLTNARVATDFAIYDLFIHLVDTAVYLIGTDKVQVRSGIREKDGNLSWAWLQLESADTLAFVSMDLTSGANKESYQVTTPDGIYRVNQLSELEIQTEQGITKKQFGDWEDTLVKRGFEPMITDFFNALQTSGKPELRQKNSHFSHRLCQEMLLKRAAHLL